MISSWRKRKAARESAKYLVTADDIRVPELTIPHTFTCPISLEMMRDPVTLSTGITYDRDSIETWLESGNITCPVTNQRLSSIELVPNHTIRKMIQDWCVGNKSYGVERIPTPRIPVTSNQVSGILSKIEEACRQGNIKACLELVTKVKSLVKESDRNKRSFADNGTGRVVSEVFSEGKFDDEIGLLGEALSALALMLPLDQEAISPLVSPSSMKYLVWFLKFGDLAGRTNAVLTLKETVSLSQTAVNDLVEIEGAMEALFGLIKEPIFPITTRATLTTIYHLVSSNEKAKTRSVEMGMVSFLLEMLVDCERGVCERALGVFDELCSCREGREEACRNALTVPVLVKKILRVSDLATEFSVSILLNMSKRRSVEETRGGVDCCVVVEALQVGAFQKLLLLLQVGSSESTKEKASELLKLLNLHRDGVECIESMDFKNLKRSI